MQYERILRSGAAALVLFINAGLAEEPHGAQRIYRCEERGQTTFSDRPCREVPSTEVQLPPANYYHLEATSNTESAKPAKPGRQAASERKTTSSIAAEHQREQMQCQRLLAKLKVVREKMRSGYSAEQGEKLRERQRQLEQQRRTERCR